MLVADKGTKGEGYVRGSFENVLQMARKSGDEDGVRELKNRAEIEDAVGTLGGGSGDWGYVNHRSGWADAEAAMRWLRSQVEKTGRVSFLHAEAVALLKSPKEGNGKEKVTGVRLKDGSDIEVDLAILATGAWTGKLVDLRGRATATGQVLVFLDLTEEEQERLGKMPVLLNMSTGLFVMPPKGRVLKVARHAYGYSNPVSIRCPDGDDEGKEITVSLPRTSRDDLKQRVPKEGEDACRAALTEMIPFVADRPFTNARICWYTDTPKGDFLITYHPEIEGLFLATGGSGHGYKFLPVIGDRIVDCLSGTLEGELMKKWGWQRERTENVITEDGSRGGRPGMVLDDEFRKGEAYRSSESR